MNDQAQRIAIAEACGLSPKQIEREAFEDGLRLAMGAPRKFGGHIMTIPDYLNDLNAMHEAEQWLKDNSTTMVWRRYWENLSEVCQPSVEYWRATARQRAEAFLRTIGKWEE